VSVCRLFSTKKTFRVASRPPPRLAIKAQTTSTLSTWLRHTTRMPAASSLRMPGRSGVVPVSSPAFAARR
jgi:hypothetical protein